MAVLHAFCNGRCVAERTSGTSAHPEPAEGAAVRVDDRKERTVAIIAQVRPVGQACDDGPRWRALVEETHALGGVLFCGGSRNNSLIMR